MNAQAATATVERSRQDTTKGADANSTLAAAGLSGEAASAWLNNRPSVSGKYRQDIGVFGRTWAQGLDLIAKLPAKASRNSAQANAAALIHRTDREARDAFLIAHAGTLYRALTNDLSKFVRVEDLVDDASSHVPGLVPARDELAREIGLDQSAREGREIDQAIFLSRVFSDEQLGMHLCHAMLLPRAESLEMLPRFQETGRVDLAGASLERRGKAAILTLRNTRYLNAEDTGTIGDQEIAADLAILDPNSDIAVLRGAVVEHPKYPGRRLFSGGLNLTHLYRGMIPYIWYITRDMGFVNKLMRGVAKPDRPPEDPAEGSTEKPWIAAVEGFAIGGGCQILLTVDYVLAASDAYMTLPARKEGIIPGCANLRLPRFVGDRIARQAIMYGRRLDCDSPEGRLICDEVVPPEEMDAALDRVIDGMTSSGVVSACGNRRAIRVGQEQIGRASCRERV